MLIFSLYIELFHNDQQVDRNFTSSTLKKIRSQVPFRNFIGISLYFHNSIAYTLVFRLKAVDGRRERICLLKPNNKKADGRGTLETGFLCRIQISKSKWTTSSASQWIISFA